MIIITLYDWYCLMIDIHYLISIILLLLIKGLDIGIHQNPSTIKYPSLLYLEMQRLKNVVSLSSTVETFLCPKSW